MSNEMKAIIENDRRTVRSFIRAMKAAGIVAVSVWDGEERVACRTEKEVMDAVFSVDMSTIRFKVPGAEKFSVACIVLGNGCGEAISDHSEANELFAATAEAWSKAQWDRELA